MRQLVGIIVFFFSTLCLASGSPGGGGPSHAWVGPGGGGSVGMGYRYRTVYEDLGGGWFKEWHESVGTNPVWRSPVRVFNRDDERRIAREKSDAELALKAKAREGQNRYGVREGQSVKAVYQGKLWRGATHVADVRPGQILNVKKITADGVQFLTSLETRNGKITGWVLFSDIFND